MKRSHVIRLAIAAAAMGGFSLSLLGSVTPASADGGCANYAVYSALASGVGVSAVVSAPGATIVESVDTDLPGAQAEYDSISGSSGWAGAPYSETVSDNLGGIAGIAPNQIPVFAVSAYPTDPATTKSLGAATLTTASDANGSNSSVTLGSTPAADASTGGVSTSASTACAQDGTLTATADEDVEGLNVAGVLQIGAVRTHAQVVVDPDGRRHTNATIDIEAASVLGEPVAITNQGIEVGSATAPLPSNPLADVLAGAGISLKYLAASESDQSGQALAPGLQVVIAQTLPKFGSGPVTTTITFGQAFARAAITPVKSTGGAPLGTSESASPPPPGPIVAPVSPNAQGPASPALTSTIPSPQAAPAPASLGLARTNAAAARIANWSIAPAYTALALGFLLFVAVRLVFTKLAVRIAWR